LDIVSAITALIAAYQRTTPMRGFNASANNPDESAHRRCDRAHGERNRKKNTSGILGKNLLLIS